MNEEFDPELLNEFKENSYIERSPHDRENPYSQINNALIRDNSISYQCRGFLIHLLSNKKDWKISVVAIAYEQGMSKKAVYKIITEAIEAGYILRIEYLENGLKRYRYQVSEEKRFKKSLLCSQKRCIENGNTLKNTILKKEHKRESSSSAPPAPPKVPPAQNGVQKLSAGNYPQTHIKNRALTPLNPKEEMRKRISSDISEEEFEEAWKRHEAQPKGSIKNLFKWLTVTLNNLRQENIGLSERKSIVEQRKQWARENEYNSNCGYGCATLEGYETCSGNLCTFHPYLADNDFWRRFGL